MKLKNIQGTDLEIDFDKYTQIAIIDINLGNDIFEYITSYFCGNKYTEDQLYKYNYELPEIEEDSKQISRTRFDIYGANEYRNIDEWFKFSKDSPLMEYNKTVIDSIDVRVEIDELERQYIELQKKIQRSYDEIDIISMKDVIINQEELLSKYFNISFKKHYSSFEKIKQFIKILGNISKINNKNYIIYLNNVETYLTAEELFSIRKIVDEVKTIYMIVGTNKSEYLNFTDIEKVNFIIDKRVVQMPPIEIMMDKINRNIKDHKEKILYEVIEFLSRNCMDVIKEMKVDLKNDEIIRDAILCSGKETVQENEELYNCIII